MTETTLTMIDPKSAEPKLFTANPILNQFFVISEASQKVAALITKTNNPSVIMISPQDNTLRMGRTRAFTKPKIKAMIANASHLSP